MSTQHPIQWVWGAYPLGIKWPGSETDHSPPFNDEVKNGEALPPLPIRSNGAVHNSLSTGATLPLSYLNLDTSVNIPVKIWIHFRPLGRLSYRTFSFKADNLIFFFSHEFENYLSKLKKKVCFVAGNLNIFTRKLNRCDLIS
jgi:hypothetical protein